jgi:hypothetical protein
VVAGIERLRVGQAVRGGSRHEERRDEASPLDLGGDGDPGHLAHRGHDVDQTDRLRRDPASEFRKWRGDDQRDMESRLVDEETVRRLLVLAQAFAVVGREDEEEVVAESVAVEEIPEPGELGIRIRDFAEIGILSVLALERLGRGVGRVGVVEVDPGEEFAVLLFVDPAQGLVDDFVRRPLDLAERDLLETAQVELVEIRVEALVQPPLGVEDVGGDEGRRVVALGLEGLGHGHELRGDDEAAVVADAVENGQGAGHDRRVRGQRQRRLRDGALVADSLGGKGVHGRRGDVSIAVAADLVGAKRVHGDEDDVPVLVAPEAAEVRRMGPEKEDGQQAGEGQGRGTEDESLSFGHRRSIFYHEKWGRANAGP